MARLFWRPPSPKKAIFVAQFDMMGNQTAFHSGA
jgi:hypothetical protein